MVITWKSFPSSTLFSHDFWKEEAESDRCDERKKLKLNWFRRGMYLEYFKAKIFRIEIDQINEKEIYDTISAAIKSDSRLTNRQHTSNTHFQLEKFKLLSR